MATTYYLWSPISNADPKKRKAVGDKVTQSDLGVDDAEWEYLLSVGAIRTNEYPDTDVAPAQHFKEQAAAMSEGLDYDAPYSHTDDSGAQEQKDNAEDDK